ncbi:hypothetical protein ACHAW6_011790 [Cyclotella cf. meneghiniana]
MVFIGIDSNVILVKPLKNRNMAEFIRPYDTLVMRLHQAGFTPQKHILDNEISVQMKDHIHGCYKFQFELVPPGCHQCNAAEVAIRNFKRHFLSSTPLSGPFNYNKMPLAPMGCKVQVHKKTDTQGTWAFHSIDEWYLYTSPEHYWVHNCHIKSARAERLRDTVSFLHKHITNPLVLHADKLINALAHCKCILRRRVNNTATQELHELQTIVHQVNTAIRHTNYRVMTPNTCDGTMCKPQLELPIPRVPAPTPIPRVASPAAILPNDTIQQSTCITTLHRHKARRR